MRRKLTELQLRTLWYARLGLDLYTGCMGRSERGGRDAVIGSLFRRGLIDRQYRPTEAGLEILRANSTTVTWR